MANSTIVCLYGPIKVTLAAEVSFDGFLKNKIFSTKQALVNVHMMGVEAELL